MISRHQNNGGRNLPVSQAVCDRYPVHVGHYKIEHETVKLLGPHRIQHRCAALESSDVEALRFEKKTKRTEYIEVVIDDADIGLLERRWHLEGRNVGEWRIDQW